VLFPRNQRIPENKEAPSKAITFNLEVNKKNWKKDNSDISQDHRFLILKKMGGAVYISKKNSSPINTNSRKPKLRRNGGKSPPLLEITQRIQIGTSEVPIYLKEINIRPDSTCYSQYPID